MLSKRCSAERGKPVRNDCDESHVNFITAVMKRFALPPSIGAQRRCTLKFAIDPYRPNPGSGKSLSGNAITASNESYASQYEAHRGGRDALDRILLEYATLKRYQ